MPNFSRKALKQKGVTAFQLLNSSERNELLNWYAKHTPNHAFTGFYSTMFFEDAAYREAVNKAISSVVQPKLEDLLPDYEILFANFICKEANQQNGLDLHADWMYVDESAGTSYNLWVSLNGEGQKQGEMEFIHGSHLWENPFRYTPYERPSYFDFLEELKQQTTPYEYKPGTALLYDGRILHGSKPNVSNRDRLVINMVLKPKELASIHWYKKNADTLAVYETVQPFYFHYRLDAKPQLGANLINEIAVPKACFTAEVLKPKFPFALWQKVKR